MKSIRHHFSRFFYGLWIELPGWVAFFSIFWLVSVFSVSTSIATALFLGIGTTLVLLATNAFFSWASRASYFQNEGPHALRYLLPVLRAILYLLCASMLVPFLELLFRVTAPQAYVGLRHLTPYLPIGCLILSQFGAYPRHHTVRDATIDGLFTGAGFTLFLSFVAIATRIFAHYGKNPFYGAALGGMVLALIAYAGHKSQEQDPDSM